jgi:Thioredoxin domain
VSPSPPEPAAVVTVVRAAACHLCEDAQVALADLASRYPLDVSYLDATEPAGGELVNRYRVGMLPLVVVDGRFFSQGRLPRRKLGALLGARVHTDDPVGTR